MITLTENAVKYFNSLDLDGKVVLFSIVSKGCGGLVHSLDIVDIVESLNAAHKIYNVSDINIAIPNEVEEYLSGTEIDFFEEDFIKEVRFNNPNLNAACGCGKSFSLKE